MRFSANTLSESSCKELTFNSLYEIHISFGIEFEFDLVRPFNSLYEIHENLRAGKIIVGSTFNSLYEILQYEDGGEEA